MIIIGNTICTDESTMDATKLKLLCNSRYHAGDSCNK